MNACGRAKVGTCKLDDGSNRIQRRGRRPPPAPCQQAGCRQHCVAFAPAMPAAGAPRTRGAQRCRRSSRRLSCWHMMGGRSGGGSSHRLIAWLDLASGQPLNHLPHISLPIPHKHPSPSQPHLPHSSAQAASPSPLASPGAASPLGAPRRGARMLKMLSIRLWMWASIWRSSERSSERVALISLNRKAQPAGRSQPAAPSCLARSGPPALLSHWLPSSGSQ